MANTLGNLRLRGDWANCKESAVFFGKGDGGGIEEGRDRVGGCGERDGVSASGRMIGKTKSLSFTHSKPRAAILGWRNSQFCKESFGEAST